MNIKSNSKRKGPGFLKSAWLGFLEMVPEKIGALGKLTIMVAAFSFAAWAWSYSGMLSVFLVVFGFILIVQDEWNDIGFFSRMWFTLFAGLGVLMLGSPNMYHTNKNEMKVEYSKLTFTDSTEKIIIFMTSPVKQTINQPLSTEEYYTLKETQDDINMTITESGEYDHWSMLRGRESEDGKLQADDIEEYTYAFTIETPDKVIENPYWLKSKTRKFVTEEKKK